MINSYNGKLEIETTYWSRIFARICGVIVMSFFTLCLLTPIGWPVLIISIFFADSRKMYMDGWRWATGSHWASAKTKEQKSLSMTLYEGAPPDAIAKSKNNARRNTAIIAGTVIVIAGIGFAAWKWPLVRMRLKSLVSIDMWRKGKEYAPEIWATLKNVGGEISDEILDAFGGEHYIYVLISAAGTIHYIGETNNVRRRMKEHAKSKDWFNNISYGCVLSFPDAASAKAEEKRLIQELNPKQNKQHKVLAA